ncbi:MAG: hypothetical protein GYB54_02575 [Gammaproteobacteria bacterium]|nr:hypothetical protein [Gammaproteobacteria bacterium]
MIATTETQAPTPDDINEMLVTRNEELEQDKHALNEQLDRAEAANEKLRQSIRRARIYAGDHLMGDAAKVGAGIVHLLEQALKEGPA